MKLPVIIILALVILLIGYVTGRHMTPPRVITQDKVQVVEKQTTVIEQKIDTTALLKAIQDISKTTNVIRSVVTEKKPDGTVVTHDTIEDHSTTVSHSDETTTTGKQTITNATGEKGKTTVEEHLKIIEKPLRAWLLGIDVGYHLPSLWGQDIRPNLSPVTGMVFGLHAGHRLFGPIWAGLWVQSTLNTGLSLGLEF